MSDLRVTPAQLERGRSQLSVRSYFDADLYRTVAYLSQISPTFSLRGGTREILRGMIARGLGLR